MADSENISDEVKAFAKKPHGKAILIAGGLIALYIAWKVFGGSSSTSANAPVTTGATTDGTSGSGSAGGGSSSDPTNADAALSPSDALAAWFSEVEGKAIAADPTNAATIDATIGDLQNNVPLTTVEEQEWQKLLGQFGAPPSAVGGQGDLFTPPPAAQPRQYVYSDSTDKQILLDAGVPMSQLEAFGSNDIRPDALYVGAAGTLAQKAGLNVQTLIGATRVETKQLVDNLLGVTTGSGGIATNGNNPSNSNLTPSPGVESSSYGGPHPGLGAPKPVQIQGANPPTATQVGSGYDTGMNSGQYSHLSTFQGLTPGTALYYEPTPGNFVHISSPGALQKLAPGTPIYTQNH